jgi:hypothetical protein
MKDIIAKTIGFKALNNMIQFQLSTKHANNIVSGIHATATSLALIEYFYNPTKKKFNSIRSFSTAYFLYDIGQIISYQKLHFMQFSYIYHHLAAIYMLHIPKHIIPISEILLLGELSNLPGYPLYYYLHTKTANKQKIAFLRLLQKFMYAGIRVPVMTQMLIQFLRKPYTPAKKLAYPIFPVWLMGMIWSFKIISQ